MCEQHRAQRRRQPAVLHPRQQHQPAHRDRRLPLFKAATVLSLFPTGAAQQGTLLNNTNVRTGTGAFLLFAANTGLALDAAGNAFSGVIASDTSIHTGAGSAPCMAAQLVNLFPTGNLQTCVLFSTMTFPNGSGGTLSCGAGHRITLSAAGIFLSCP